MIGNQFLEVPYTEISMLDTFSCRIFSTPNINYVAQLI